MPNQNDTAFRPFRYRTATRIRSFILGLAVFATSVPLSAMEASHLLAHQDAENDILTCLVRYSTTTQGFMTCVETSMRLRCPATRDEQQSCLLSVAEAWIAVGNRFAEKRLSEHGRAFLPSGKPEFALLPWHMAHAECRTRRTATPKDANTDALECATAAMAWRALTLQKLSARDTKETNR